MIHASIHVRQIAIKMLFAIRRIIIFIGLNLEKKQSKGSVVSIWKIEH